MSGLKHANTAPRSHLKLVFHLYPSVMSDSVLESPADPNDAQLIHYLTSTWTKIGQAFGMEFGLYLPLVMPYVL